MQFFFGQYHLYTDAIELDKDELKHCLKVLRKKKGDLIQVTDGTGKIYHSRIINDHFKNPEFKCESIEEISSRSFGFSIAIAPTKNLQRIEWFLEKSTEIGIDEIYFFQTSRTERSKLKMDRFRNICKSAAKQSGNIKLPELNDIATFTELLHKPHFENYQKFIAYCEKPQTEHFYQKVEKGKDILVLIGPEGDFTPKEIELAIQKDFRPISLGNSRLRTETAGIVACEIVNLANL